MKLTKEEKRILKEKIVKLKENDGFIHFLNGGITRVYMPLSTSKNNRMYWYGQAVCNKSDKYKKKVGIMLALKDFDNSNKTIPIELIFGLTESSQFIEGI